MQNILLYLKYLYQYWVLFTQNVTDHLNVPWPPQIFVRIVNKNKLLSWFIFSQNTGSCSIKCSIKTYFSCNHSLWEQWKANIWNYTSRTIKGHMQINYIFGKELTALRGSGVFHGILFVPGLVTLFLSSPFSICRSWPPHCWCIAPMGWKRPWLSQSGKKARSFTFIGRA